MRLWTRFYGKSFRFGICNHVISCWRQFWLQSSVCIEFWIEGIGQVEIKPMSEMPSVTFCSILYCFYENTLKNTAGFGKILGFYYYTCVLHNW